MWGALFSGMVLGATLALLVGPVFFALIQTSLRQGFRAGLYMIGGIAFSDLTYIVLAYFGLASFAHTAAFQFWMGSIGGSVMVIFGVASIIKAKSHIRPKDDETPSLKRTSPLQLAVRGFALNGLNPFVVIYWLTVTSNVIGRYPGQAMQHWLFIAAMLVTAVSADVLKAYAAKKLSRLLTDKLMYWIAMLVGIALIAFGLRTVWSVSMAS